jgi:hypothetical protein
VAYTPVAKRRLCKQRPLLGNTRYNRKTVFLLIRAAVVSGQQLFEDVPAATDTNATIEEQYFLCGSCREVVTRTVGAMNSVSSSRKTMKKGPERVKLKNLHC